MPQAKVRDLIFTVEKSAVSGDDAWNGRDKVGLKALLITQFYYPSLNKVWIKIQCFFPVECLMGCLINENDLYANLPGRLRRRADILLRASIENIDLWYPAFYGVYIISIRIVIGRFYKYNLHANNLQQDGT